MYKYTSIYIIINSITNRQSQIYFERQCKRIERVWASESHRPGLEFHLRHSLCDRGWLNLSELHVPVYKMDNIINLTRLLWGLNEIVHTKHICCRAWLLVHTQQMLILPLILPSWDQLSYAHMKILSLYFLN